MMSNKLQAFSSSLIFLLILVAGGIISAGLAITSFGSQKEGELPVVSLSAKEEPLRKVLDKISIASGYEIILNGESGDLSVSVTFKNAALGEALKRVLRDLNYVAVWDQGDKSISLTVYVLRGAEKNIKTQPGISHDEANPRVLIHPPSKTKNGSGVTAKRPRQNRDFEVSITGKNRTFVQGSKTTID
jgi:hypothetical protein